MHCACTALPITADLTRCSAFLDEWDKGFFTYSEQPEGYPLPVMEGQLPPEIAGTYYRWALAGGACRRRR
jgi:hypothetical protein